MKKIWAMVTGTIRNELYFRIVIIKLCDLRCKGKIEKIIYSTWEGEVDKVSGLRNALKELGIILVESPYIDEVSVSKLHGSDSIVYERQREVIANGIKKIPSDCFVLKLRTDGNRGINNILKALDESDKFATIKYGNFPISFDYKLVIRFINFKQLLYGFDQYYVASKETLNKLTLPLEDKKIWNITFCPETRMHCGYAYIFYDLLRETWEIIPERFYDLLWMYCRKHNENKLVLPRLVHRILATICVYIYTQVHFVGDDNEDYNPVSLIDLFSDRIKTNNQIRKICLGNLVDTQLALVFKDELRKVSLYLPEARSYTYEEYEELRKFCEIELKNKKLIRSYPYILENGLGCDVNFISNNEEDALNTKVIQSLAVNLEARKGNYNYFRYNLEKNKRYTVRLNGIEGSVDRYTAGIFDFSSDRKIHFDDYNVSRSACFNFVTGEFIGKAAFLIYAGVHGKTSGEHLKVEEFDIYAEDIYMDKKYAGKVMLGKYQEDCCTDELVSLINQDFDFDGWQLYLQVKDSSEEDRGLKLEILKLSTYDRNPIALSEYAAKLRVNPKLYDYETFAHTYKFLRSIFNMGLKAELIIAIYNYICNYYHFLPVHGMGTRRIMLWAVNRLLVVIDKDISKLVEVPSNYKFQTILIEYLYRCVEDKNHLTPTCAVIIEAVMQIAEKNPFSSHFIELMKTQGYGELSQKVEERWKKQKFIREDWLASKHTKQILATRDNQRIFKYAFTIKNLADIKMILDYYSDSYFYFTQEEKKMLVESVEHLTNKFEEEPFLVRAARFMKTNQMVISYNDVTDIRNFLILIEIIFNKNNIGSQYNKLMKMCFADDWRKVIMYAFKRIERDNRLSYITVKDCTEILFYNRFILNNYRSAANKLIAYDKEGSRIFATHENQYQLLGAIRLCDKIIFLSAEFIENDKEGSQNSVHKTELNIANQRKHLLNKQFEFFCQEDIEKVVDLAFDEFCKMGANLLKL